MSEELKALHARRLWLDATSILGLISAVIVMTWMVSNERSEIKSKLEVLAEAIKAVSAKQELYTKLLDEQWTRNDMENYSRMWCKAAELSNKGWTCPDLSVPVIRQR